MQVYMDQAGNPNPNDPSPYSVLMCVCIDEAQCRVIARRLHKIKENYLDMSTIRKTYGLLHELGLESPNNIKPLKQAIGNQEPTTLELKGIYFAGRESFARITNAREIVNSVVGLADSLSAVFAIVMPKPNFKPYTAPGMLADWHYFMLQRIDAHMRNTAPGTFATIISDEYGRQEDAGLATCFSNFLCKSPEGQHYLILETPLFVNSALCPGIQIADVFAYVGRQYFCQGLDNRGTTSDAYGLWIKRLWEQEIRRRSPNYLADPSEPTGLLYWGVFKMPITEYRPCPTLPPP